MDIASAIALYFILWWIAFFIVLPLGRRDPDPEHARVSGAEGSAPANPRLKLRVAITTVLAALLLAALIAILNSGLRLEDVPLPSPPGV